MLRDEETTLSYISTKSGKTRHITLIDPAKQDPEVAANRAMVAVECGTEMIFVGGSTDTPDEVVHATCVAIQESLELRVFAASQDPNGNEDSWKFPPFSGTIEGDKLYGRGSEDMKSSVACFISATKRFIEKYKKIPGKLSFIITGDEERDSVNGTPKILEWASKNNYKFDHCLVGEPTSNKEIGDKIKIGRRGAISFYIQVKGIQGHTANAHLAENASHHLIRLLNNILDNPLDKGNKNFLPSSTQIATFDVGNPVPNIIPELAKATVNIRFNDMHSSDTLINWMEEKINNIFKNVTNASCQFTYDSTAESFLNQPGYMCDLIAKSVSDVTGKNSKPEHATDGGTSDARYIKNYCEVVELGIRNQSLHKVDEFVYTKDVIELEKIYFQILENYFSSN